MNSYVVVNFSLATCMADISLYNGTKAECEAYVREHSCAEVNNLCIVDSQEAEQLFREAEQLKEKQLLKLIHLAHA